MEGVLSDNKRTMWALSNEQFLSHWKIQRKTKEDFGRYGLRGRRGETIFKPDRFAIGKRSSVHTFHKETAVA